MEYHKRYEVKFSEWGDHGCWYATFDVNEEVINRVDDEWRSSLYDLRTEEDIAIHLAHNLFVNEINLSSMDGWADLTPDYVKVVTWPDFYWEEELDVWELDIELKKVIELTPVVE